MLVKKILYFIPLLSIFLCVSQKIAESCPTCIGKVNENSVPFFIDECYEYNFDSIDFSGTDTNS